MARGKELRPVERRMVKLSESGVDDVEIAWRFRRSPRFVKQVRELAQRRPEAPPVPGPALRPIERRLLKWRELGLDHEELAPRFRRSADFLARVEHLARYKMRQG
ncbi:MAG TPA: hypothetical protein VM618_03845 [Acidimicrobiia bacterium]|nr:hypothetical protein [Acidimicrobiia bacterium]